MTATTPALAGRTAVITGANQGLGLAIARAYVAAGASVLLCARDETLLNDAKQALAAAVSSTPNDPRPTTREPQIIEAVPADVSSQADVARLSARAFELFPQVHILVNNAGVNGPLGPAEQVDWDSWVRTIEINLFGSVLLSRAFVPHFKHHRYGKIVQLSGGGATNPMPRNSAYAASKAAIVRFAESLAIEIKPFGIDVNALAPGALNTRMLDDVIAADPDVVGKEYYQRMLRIKAEGGAPLEQAAALAVYFGSARSDGITGRLVSAVWDPWETLDARRPDLETSDVYTLRRITPKDRGLTWGER
jgi:NAD(P)-dependent dehydrogenase (short-subunit alcohol dehydrogenase family)